MIFQIGDKVKCVDFSGYYESPEDCELTPCPMQEGIVYTISDIAMHTMGSGDYIKTYTYLGIKELDIYFKPERFVKV